MIEREELDIARRWFATFVDRHVTGLPAPDLEVQGRAAHSLRVARECVRIGTGEGMSPGEVRLLRVLGLLHDVGRFEQYRRYGCCDDLVTEDHALLGVQVLDRENLFTCFSPRAVERVSRAILHHNRTGLPRGEEAMLPYARILRDGDKLDILDRGGGKKGDPGPPWNRLSSEPRLSPGVLSPATAGQLIPLLSLRTRADLDLLRLCWLGELETATGRRLAVARGLLEKLAASLPPTPELAGIVAGLARRLTAAA